jgi:ATP-dependent RNA helicase DDX5/DBP2
MHNLPKPHQTLLFSATMPTEVETLAADYLTKPVKVKVGSVHAPTANVSQHLEKVPEAAKMDRLCELMLEEQAEAAKLGRTVPMTVVFVERKQRCDDVAELLTAEGVGAVPLHGGRSQSEREGALREFAAGRVPVLVATDVASRGLDIKGIAHVINMDLPKPFEDYVHRIGRTGRAGATGRATSFYTDRDTYIVSQIKLALAELERGNAMAFASGKEARRKERETAEAWRNGTAGPGAVDETLTASGVKLDEKYKFMSLAGGGGTPKAGAAAKGSADDAWDD